MGINLLRLFGYWTLILAKILQVLFYVSTLNAQTWSTCCTGHCTSQWNEALDRARASTQQLNLIWLICSQWNFGWINGFDLGAGCVSYNIYEDNGRWREVDRLITRLQPVKHFICAGSLKMTLSRIFFCLLSMLFQLSGLLRLTLQMG